MSDIIRFYNTKLGNVKAAPILNVGEFPIGSTPSQPLSKVRHKNCEIGISKPIAAL